MNKNKRIQRNIYSPREIAQMTYLRKFSDKYKVKQNLDGSFEIVCNFGKTAEALICVYNFPLKEREGTNNLLFCLTLNFGRKRAYFIENKAKEISPNILINQTSQIGESSFVFPERDLKKLEDVLKIRKKKKCSPKMLKHLEMIRGRIGK